MKRILAILFSFALAALGQPAFLTPPGFVPTVSTNVFQIECRDFGPTRMVMFFVSTNCPPRWRIERSDRVAGPFALLEKWDTTNAYPRSQVPWLRDNARLVTWVLEGRTAPQRFYRLTVL